MGPGMKLERFKVGVHDQPDAPESDLGEAYWFWCPGCETHHSFRTKAAKGETRGGAVGGGPPPLWTFNGDMERPTFSPSLLYTGWKNEKDKSVGRCHLFVRNGLIEFCGDCDHALAGKTVPLATLPGAGDPVATRQ